jgi:hypothetical protein
LEETCCLFFHTGIYSSEVIFLVGCFNPEISVLSLTYSQCLGKTGYIFSPLDWGMYLSSHTFATLANDTEFDLPLHSERRVAKDLITVD